MGFPPFFLKGDQDGGGGIQAEKNFANGSGIYSENLKDWESWRGGSASADALDAGGMPEHRSWDFLRGERDCLGSCWVSHRAACRKQIREAKMEGNGRNCHPKPVKVGKTDPPRAPPQDFGIVPESPCVPGSSPSAGWGRRAWCRGCHPAPRGFSLSTRPTSIPFQIFSARSWAPAAVKPAGGVRLPLESHPAGCTVAPKSSRRAPFGFGHRRTAALLPKLQKGGS